MGGKALNKFGIKTERKTTEEFLRLQSEMLEILSTMFKTKLATIEFYRKKETHGDCDILALNDGTLGDIKTILSDRFGIINNNSGIYSYEYQKFQFDFICVPTRNWETSKEFFDYDPTGNLMGKIAHKFGCKYGFEGLVYPFRNFSGRLSTNITISRDSNKIFNFLGLDYNRYSHGFDTLEEIFDFITNSKYFNSSDFQFENLTGIDRKRNQKRDTFKKFLAYINSKDYKNSFQFGKKSDYIDIIDTYFPEANLKGTLESLKIEDLANKSLSEKFNGDIVMELTGLKGKELGKFLNNFKYHIEKESGQKFKEFIFNCLSIKESILEFFNNYK